MKWSDKMIWTFLLLGIILKKWFSFAKDMVNFEAFQFSLGYFCKHILLIFEEWNTLTVCFEELPQAKQVISLEF